MYLGQAVLALTRTPLGPQIYSIGGDPEAARRFGVNTTLVTIVSYAICGLMAAGGGVVIAARLASASPLAPSARCGIGFQPPIAEGINAQALV